MLPLPPPLLLDPVLRPFHDRSSDIPANRRTRPKMRVGIKRVQHVVTVNGRLLVFPVVAYRVQFTREGPLVQIQYRPPSQRRKIGRPQGLPSRDDRMGDPHPPRSRSPTRRSSCAFSTVRRLREQWSNANTGWMVSTTVTRRYACYLGITTNCTVTGALDTSPSMTTRRSKVVPSCCMPVCQIRLGMNLLPPRPACTAPDAITV